MGNIVSYKYIGKEGHDINDRPMALFKVTYSKKSQNSNVHAMEFSLDGDHKIYGFAFLVTSEKIKKMLKEN